MNAPFIRAFFGIELPQACKQQLDVMMAGLEQYLKTVYKKTRTPFRWVQPQNLHLTLQFLAQIKQSDVIPMLRQVCLELARFKVFKLGLGPLEWFPSPYRAQVLILKGEPHEFLQALSQAIGRGVVALNYPLEQRPFRAHVTLARAAVARERDPEVLKAFSWAPLPDLLIKELVFFRSDSQIGRSVYTPMARIGLNE